MGEVLFGSTLLASFLGGVVALLAPCCVSVMLPAYLATGFRHRGGVVPATLVFGAGVATVILPIGLGATFLSSLLLTRHVWIFSIGGALMIAGGLATLAGWKPRLPMPGGRAVREGSFGSAYVLGAFSGAASACCAPVLAGVAVLSGAAASFPAALAIGASYVAGMVVPLAVVALLWDKRREHATRLLTDRKVRLRRREIALGTLVSGALMMLMGVLAAVLAFTGPGMSGGWQVELSAWLQHLSSVAAGRLSWLPGWGLAALLALGFALLVRRVLRTRSADRTRPSEENSREQQR
ncbi:MULTISPECIES: cytochrome c biogenesis CcdA family protein [Amycolatopsis]|uniref:Cytochrome c biogenesis protein CcdA n=1 Tax=Amycolatopsis echigonensis TaxID=2576905 RepID=A0A2N3WL58_9PSEU|nr:MULTISPECIES: cytochrome c biogenesis CcdA family protein [Amycolatopsis]MBB2499923.1 cytochrome c biogenesis protein CcdA [Amycolatopsis echigonensis]MCG3751159.1 cytochrome c biogenesis protein CcdA [Amycolatopsis sp. Poz14]PKV94621.1 cytochrome c biogenesis protein CcdA [Amycolatopsis niigatensis]